MNLFLLVSLHILAIAMGGLVWGIVGQGLMRRFLAAPLFILIIAMALRLYALGLAFTFNPVTS